MRPIYFTRSIGREAALADLESRLADDRLLNLIDLASISDATLLPQSVATMLNLRSQPGQPLQQTLIDALSRKRCVLLLDNCEHLITDCARLAYALLHGCPYLKIITTSHQPLGIAFVICTLGWLTDGRDSIDPTGPTNPS
jgi:non-specific serine/threonine protein kinase